MHLTCVNCVLTMFFVYAEYAYAARITTKVDVYSYGVVLLEMLTQKRPTQVSPAGLSLHEWVKSRLSANIEEVLHASVMQRSPFNNADTCTSLNPHLAAVQLLRMGVACTEAHPNDRPTIQEVLGFLTFSIKEGSQRPPVRHHIPANFN